jgi:hypothetical protein
MAWSLGEDSFDWSHIKAMADELAKGGYGSGEPSGHQSHPMIPAAGPGTSDSTPLEQGPVDPKAPNVASASTPSAKKDPISVVFVDGTTNGPAGDHATEPGSPAGFVVSPGQSEEASTPQQKKPLQPVAPAAPQQADPFIPDLPPPVHDNVLAQPAVPAQPSPIRKPRPSRRPAPSRKPRPSRNSRPFRKPTPLVPLQASPAQTPSPARPSPSENPPPFSSEFFAAMNDSGVRKRMNPRVTAAPRGKVDLNRKAARAPRKRRGKKVARKGRV